MNITQEKTGDLTARLNIEIVEQDYQEKLQQELKNYRKRAAIPGFRPGKVPQSLIEKKFGPSLLAEEINKIISESLDNYLKEEKLDILGYPIPVDENESPDFSHFKDFTFSFDYALSPKIDIDLSQGTEFEYLKLHISEEIVNSTVSDIQNQFSKTVDAENISPDAKFQISAKELDGSGKPVEGGIDSTANIDFNNITDETIKNLLNGLRIGDKVFFNPISAFGDTEKAAKLLAITDERAKLIKDDFEIEITGITRLEPAEVNLELFRKAFPGEEITDYEAFIDQIKKEIRKSYSVEEDKFFLQQTFNTLIQKANVELPDDFTKRWLFVSNDGKISKEIIEKEYPQYRKAMIMQLVEKELMNQYPEIIVKQDDVKNEVKRFYEHYFRFQDEISDENTEALERIAENFLKNKEETQKIYEQLFNQKLTALFKSKLKLKEREVTLDEFKEEINKTYIPEHLHHYEDHDHDHGHHDHNHID